ncbi:hypothetical protein [Natrinema salifodinae]|uniref:Uncharacterized protein n=1 Tax=Natrinema salifodinae TaxID=1202768 RepID=A0A1I0PS88_9EURY|nr:hypothetical protein [Natrinema salifodinae]SEW17243.1 hypothetical protein SAMN05216285_2883 [Natrinema salifodinae]
MGFLQSILGTPTPPEEPDSEPTIDLPEDEYAVAYPVSVRQSQLKAFQSVIDAERETPHLDGPGADLVKDALKDTWEETTPGDETLEESIKETRSRAENLIAAWQETHSGEHDVIFLPASVTFRLRGFLVSCETRADNDEDPFTLPDEFVDAVSLLKTLRKAEEEKDPVFVHKDQLPER